MMALEQALMARGPGVTADRTVFHTPTPAVGSLPRAVAPRFARRPKIRRSVLNPGGVWQRIFRRRAFRPDHEVRAPKLKR
jgi:hypothetical protein